MGIVLKETIKGSVYQYAGILLGGLNVAILFPKFLGVENWGVLSIIISFVLISSQFTQLGSPNIILKYFPRLKEDKLQKHFISLSFVLGLLGTFIFILVYLVFKDNFFAKYSGEWKNSFQILFAIPIYVLFNTLFQILCSFLVISYNSSLVFLLREFLLRLFQTISVGLFVFFELDFTSFVYLYVFSYFLVFSLSFVIILSKKIFRFSDIFKFQKEVKMKEYFLYGFYTIVSGFSSSFVSNIDILMVGALLLNGEALSGKYKTAIYLATLISVPLRPLFQIMYSLVSNWWKEDKNAEIEKMYQQSAQYGILISGLLLSLLLININWLETYLFSNLNESFWIILFFGLGQFFLNATGINGTIMNLSKYYRVTTYSIIILAVLNLGLNYILINLYGINGAALATGLSLAIINIFRLLFVSKKLHLQIITKNLTLVTIISAVVISFLCILEYNEMLNWVMSIYLNLLIIALVLTYVFTTKLHHKVLTLLKSSKS